MKAIRWLVFAAFCNGVLAQSLPSIYVQSQDQAVAVGCSLQRTVEIADLTAPLRAVQ